MLVLGLVGLRLSVSLGKPRPQWFRLGVVFTGVMDLQVMDIRVLNGSVSSHGANPR